MKKLLSFLSLVLLGTTLNAQDIVNDANAEKRNVGSFSAISVSNAFDVFLTQGSEDAVAISASEQQYKDKIITKVENGTLKIYLENDKKFWKNFNAGKMKLKAYISFRDVDGINISGACDVVVKGSIKTDKLKLNISGASDFNGAVDVKELDVNLSGASDVDMSGRGDKIKIDVSGASKFDGYDFVTEYCDVEASGASDVRVTVNRELNARASGASGIGYKGNGVIRDIKTSGASNISKRS